MNFTARVAEFWYLLKARMALLAGRRDRARASLKSALRKNPGSFVAHFLLGRLYWRDRAVAKAKREFDLAWQIDPERFERSYARLRDQQEGVPELFSYASARDEEVSRFGVRLCDDFMSDEERRRFRAMPPISREEILQIDWDRLQEEIYRGPDAH